MSWTAYLVPSGHRRLNEFVGLLVLTCGILLALSLISFNPDDLSLNVSQNPQFAPKPSNFVGVVGAYGADIFFQLWGYSAFLLPIFLGIYAFCWLASSPVKNFTIRLAGMLCMMCTIATALGMWPVRIRDQILPGGLIGKISADALQSSFNSTGALVLLLSPFSYRCSFRRSFRLPARQRSSRRASALRPAGRNAGLPGRTSGFALERFRRK